MANEVKDPQAQRAAAFRLRALLDREPQEEQMSDRSNAMEATKAELADLELATGVRHHDGGLWNVKGRILVRQVEGAWKPLEDPPVVRTAREAVMVLTGWRLAEENYGR